MATAIYCSRPILALRALGYVWVTDSAKLSVVDHHYGDAQRGELAAESKLVPGMTLRLRFLLKRPDFFRGSK